MKLNRRGLVLAATTVAVAAAFVAGRLSAAGIPATGALTYSGTLEDAAGTPLTGTRTVDIYFWSTATIGTTPLCSTQANTTTLTAGRFSVPLPDTCTSAVQGSKDIWAEVRVDGTSLGLSKLGAVPYAVESGHTTAADNATTATTAANATNASNAIGPLAQQTVPSGAVMAFNLAACPAGWTEYLPGRGRVVVGVNPAAGALRAWARGETAGEEQHTMTASEMPSHTHTEAVYGAAGAFTNSATGLRITGGSAVATSFGSAQPSGASGDSQPFNVIQPSVALLYCMKS